MRSRCCRRTSRRTGRTPGNASGAGEDFIALNENYPGAWRCTVRRIEEYAEGVVTVTEIGDGKTGFFAVSFFTVRDGRITAAEEYFGENGPPPFDRSAWAERY